MTQLNVEVFGLVDCEIKRYPGSYSNSHITERQAGCLNSPIPQSINRIFHAQRL